MTEKKDKLKVLSKVISIIARILKVVCIVGVIGIAVGMIIIPIVHNNTKIEDKKITVFGETVSYEFEDGVLHLKAGTQETDIKDAKEVEAIRGVLTAINDKNLDLIVNYLEIMLIFVVIGLVISFTIFHYLDKLFTNIHDEDTPFTEENVMLTKRIGYLMIGLLVLPIITEFMASVVFKVDLNMNFNSTSILYILVVFSGAYILEKGITKKETKKVK